MVNRSALTRIISVQLRYRPLCLSYRRICPRRLMERPLGYEPNTARSNRVGDTEIYGCISMVESSSDERVMVVRFDSSVLKCSVSSTGRAPALQAGGERILEVQVLHRALHNIIMYLAI